MLRPIKKIRKRCATYIKQLGIFRGTQFILADVARKILNFRSRYNYSQTGEEIIIENYLPGIENGFYLDIGCNEPIFLSNTFHLYLKGWTGLCVDANEKITEKFRRFRPKDIVYSSAVSDTEEEKTYYEFEGSAVNTLDDKLISEWKDNWKLKSEKKLRTKTLNNILDELHLQNQKIDLMSVDVEGFDLNVLKSIDLNKYRPTLIVVELHKTDLSNLNQNEVVKYLANFNYSPIAFATVNGYFMQQTT